MAVPGVFEEMMHFRKGRDDAFLQGRFGRGNSTLPWYRFVHPIDLLVRPADISGVSCSVSSTVLRAQRP